MCNLYPAIHNKDGSLKHSNECKMVFGRKDEQCPRCVEMINGAPARDGWQKGYFVDKKIDEENRLRWIKEHDCKKCNCGPVCTAFDY